MKASLTALKLGYAETWTDSIDPAAREVEIRIPRAAHLSGRVVRAGGGGGVTAAVIAKLASGPLVAKLAAAGAVTATTVAAIGGVMTVRSPDTTDHPRTRPRQAAHQPGVAAGPARVALVATPPPPRRTAAAVGPPVTPVTGTLESRLSLSRNHETRPAGDAGQLGSEVVLGRGSPGEASRLSEAARRDDRAASASTGTESGSADSGASLTDRSSGGSSREGIRRAVVLEGTGGGLRPTGAESSQTSTETVLVVAPTGSTGGGEGYRRPSDGGSRDGRPISSGSVSTQSGGPAQPSADDASGAASAGDGSSAGPAGSSPGPGDN